MASTCPARILRLALVVLLLAALCRPLEAQGAPPALGAATSLPEGLSPAAVPLWHLVGLRGQGVRVGIVDEGFGGYQALLGSALPAQVTARSFVPGEDDADLDDGSSHGAALAEIVHAMAPEASLYLAKIAAPEQLPGAVSWLVDQVGVQVLLTGPRWYGLSPGDGTGPLADLVAARAQGVLWVAPAGDARLLHWCGDWADANRNDRLDFGYQQDNVRLVQDGQAQLPAGMQLRARLRWGDWEQADQDLDFCLYRDEGSDELACGDAPQTGLSTHSPTEFLSGETWGAPSVYYLYVRRLSGDRPVHLDLFVEGVTALSQPVANQSLAEIADAPGALAVAAVAPRFPYPQAPYSSQGPTKGPGGVADGGAAKPDLAAYAGVTTRSAGLLEGTAAAAAHVAGAAALVQGAYPAYGPGQLSAFLTQRALDLGAPGWDPLYGHGRLFLGPPPLPPPVQRWLPVGRR